MCLMMLTFLLTSLLSICILCHIQFFGWMVAANTLLEYLLAASTVAKGFASYFTVLIGELCSADHLSVGGSAEYALCMPSCILMPSPVGCLMSLAHWMYYCIANMPTVNC